MKNLKYILVPALAGILLASCNTEPQGPTQAELDAQVDTKVKAEIEKMKMDCDNQILQSAQWKKDSILVSMGKMKASALTSKPVPPKPVTPKVPPPPPAEPVKAEPVKAEPVKETPKGGLKGLSDQSKNEQGSPKGLKGLSDQEKAKAIKDSGRRGGLKGLSDQKK